MLSLRALTVAAGTPDLVLPEGYSLPPWPYAIALVVLLVGVLALLWALKPPITDWTSLAIVPWIATGAILYAMFQARMINTEALWPLVNSPTVYVTTAIAAGIVWIGSTVWGAMSDRSADRPLGVIGTGVAITLATLGVFVSFNEGTLTPFWSPLIFFGALILAAVIWAALSLVFTDAAAYTGKTGAVVVFGHVLDGLSTAVGYTGGVQEQTPLSRIILQAGEALSAPDLVGAGLFLLVKMVLAVGIVILFREWAREEPRQARMVLILVAAVGLGPGIHNVYLFAVSEIALSF